MVLNAKKYSKKTKTKNPLNIRCVEWKIYKQMCLLVLQQLWCGKWWIVGGVECKVNGNCINNGNCNPSKRDGEKVVGCGWMLLVVYWQHSRHVDLVGGVGHFEWIKDSEWEISRGFRRVIIFFFYPLVMSEKVEAKSISMLSLQVWHIF